MDPKINKICWLENKQNKIKPSRITLTSSVNNRNYIGNRLLLAEAEAEGFFVFLTLIVSKCGRRVWLRYGTKAELENVPNKTRTGVKMRFYMTKKLKLQSHLRRIGFLFILHRPAVINV